MSLHRRNKRHCAEPNRADIKHNMLSHYMVRREQKYTIADDQKNKV